MDASPWLTKESLWAMQASAADSRTWRLAAGGTVELRRGGDGRVYLSLNYNRHDLTEQESVLVCQLIDQARGLGSGRVGQTPGGDSVPATPVSPGDITRLISSSS